MDEAKYRNITEKVKTSEEKVQLVLGEILLY